MYLGASPKLGVPVWQIPTIRIIVFWSLLGSPNVRRLPYGPLGLRDYGVTGGIIQCYGAGLSIFKVFSALGLSGFYTCRALGSMGLGSRSRAEGPAQKIKQGRHRLVRSEVQGALGSSAKYTPIVNGGCPKLLSIRGPIFRFLL